MGCLPLDLRRPKTDAAPENVPAAAPPLEPAAEYSLEGVHPGWRGDWHPVPERVLTPTFRVPSRLSSDGQVRELVPGAVLLAEDTTGKGHVSRATGH